MNKPSYGHALGSFQPHHPLGEVQTSQEVISGTLLVAQWLRICPAMQKTWVQSLAEEDPLEKKMATQLQYILAWESPWTEEAGGLWGRKLFNTT